jgi:Domain of unknown function (DUF4376)
MKWALVDHDSICQNIIHYEVGSGYQPPEGFYLLQVNDWINIGDNINDPEPTPPTPTIEEQRADATDKLVVMRDQHIEDGVPYNGYRFYTDPNSQNLMMQAILTEINGIGEVFPTIWLTMSNEPATITLDDAKAIMGLFTTKKKANYMNYMNLLAEINVSDDPLSIDISQGWS